MNNTADTIGWVALAAAVLGVGLAVDLSPGTHSDPAAVSIHESGEGAIHAEPAGSPPGPAGTVFHDGPGGEGSDKPEWLTWPEAQALQALTGRPVLVFLSFADPAKDAACLPCQRLKKTLADPDTLRKLAELGILARSDCERWQADKLKAPAIVYVAEGDTKPPMLTDFAVGPPDKFLSQLKVWTNGL